MDRSYLSDRRVVAASRRFVCVRLATYESAEEAAFLRTIFVGRSGQLENSVFAILSPDGKKKLTRSGRSPSFAFEDAADMAEAMHDIAGDHVPNPQATAADAGLPYLRNVRLGLNVAACDAQRIAIVYAPSAKDRVALEAELAPLVWSEALAGKLLWTHAATAKDLTKIEGATDRPGVLVVEPDAYGTGGRQVAHFGLDAKLPDMKRLLIKAAADNKLGSKDSRVHIAEGRRSGIRWETEIPVTDSHGRRRK